MSLYRRIYRQTPEHAPGVARAEKYRELTGLAVQLVFPTIPALIGVGVLLILTLLATLPGVWSVVRPRPARLMATGRNG